MEGGEKSHPHRSGVGVDGGQFFICFRTRPSSSSSASSSASAAMRVRSSKSIMSPNRGRGPSSAAAPAISTSISLRFRRSGSLKGGQSPMFPSGVQITGRKKGGAFEGAEPSSPKVTCIGQVRVKAKKKGKPDLKTAMPLSRSHRGRGDGGKCCFPERKHGWVHRLPLNICEAFRSFGLELSSFVPCAGRSEPCYMSKKVREEKRCGKKIMARSGSSSTRGAEIAKWLLSGEDGEKAKGGSTMGKVGEEREKVEMELGFLLHEREEMVEVEVEETGKNVENSETMMVAGRGEDEEKEADRASVCIPPRHALLLMRCRSDPVKMAALANRFWGSPTSNPQCAKEEEPAEEGNVEEDDVVQRVEKDSQVEVSVLKTAEREEEKLTKNEEDNQNLQQPNQPELLVEDEVGIAGEVLSKDELRQEAKGIQLQEEQGNNRVARNRSHTLPEKKENKEKRRSVNGNGFRSKDGWRKRGKEKDARRHSFSSDRETRRQSFTSEREARRASFSVDRCRRWSFSVEKEVLREKDEKPILISAPEDKSEEGRPEEAEHHLDAGDEVERKILIKEAEQEEQEKKGESRERHELPDCLLMMMYEPKLSMEVSEETWVCRNDFLQCRPTNLHSTKHDGGNCDGQGDAVDKTILKVVSATVELPAQADAEAVGTEIVLPLRPAVVVPFVPVVLTRCKSEPTKSSARLAPNACFWKDRHCPISAAGIGF